MTCHPCYQISNISSYQLFVKQSIQAIFSLNISHHPSLCQSIFKNLSLFLLYIPLSIYYISFIPLYIYHLSSMPLSNLIFPSNHPFSITYISLSFYYLSSFLRFIYYLSSKPLYIYHLSSKTLSINYLCISL